jgi:drug/metabolite transporter (DMT)-like permease
LNLTATDTAPRRLGLGIALGVFATLGFALLDVTSQYVGKLVPVVMAVWFRFLFQTVTTTALLWPQYRQRLWQTRALPWQIVRGLLMIGSGTVAFMSLRVVPVGEFTAILTLVPLCVTLMASLLLRERVPVLGWLLLLGGLSGALVVMRPSSHGFDAATLLPLLLVLINSSYQIVTSRMVRTEDPGVMHFYTGLVCLICSTLAVVPAWTWIPDWHVWVLMALMGVFGSLGHYVMIHAYHHAPASRLQPYMYSQVAFATLLGWAVFGHMPDAVSFAGIALIALCGLGSVRLKAG